jgi:hypothetical protein
MYTAFYRYNTSGNYVRSDAGGILVDVIGGDFFNSPVTPLPDNSQEIIDYRAWLSAGNTPARNGAIDAYDLIGYRVQHRA